MIETCSLIALYGFSAIALAILGLRLLDGNALRKISIPGIGWSGKSRCLDTRFLFSGIAFIWIARLSTLQLNLVLDPDEAQFSANAMRIWAGGMNWDNLDSHTSGPLNSAVLAWPYLMGLDVTLTTTRMIGTVFICIMLVMLFLGIRRLASTEIAVLSSFPLFVFYASASNQQFVHYSSECLPMMLISVGIYGYLRIVGNQSAEKGRRGILLLSAFILGMVPYAKLQAAPLAALVGIALIATILFMNSKEKKWKYTFLVTCAAFLPSLIFLFPLLIRGEFHHFVTSYLLYPMYYIVKPLSMEKFFGLVRSNGFYKVVFYLYVAISGISLSLCSFFPSTIGTSRKWAAGLAALTVPVAWFCVIRSGKEFSHYLHLMLPPLALSAGVFYAICSDALLLRMRSVRLHGVMHILVCSAMIAAIIPEGKMEIENNLAYRFGGFRDGLTFKSPRLMQWLGTNITDSLLIWGWKPQWYLSTGITPATSETQNFTQIDPKFPTAYYRERFIQDFNKSRPDFVIDSVTPDSFWFHDPVTQSISSFPALAEIINDSFIRVSCHDPEGRCPRLYIRKERYVEMKRNLIPISRISASGQYNAAFSPENVNDENVFEFDQYYESYGKCISYWLLPDASTGHITLEFENSKVSSVSILNTRNGIYGYRASERVRVLVLLGETVLHQHELILNRYPYWTHYKLPEPVAAADSVRIEILSFVGKGAGLNEVKIYRESSEGME